jgi:hypothetical protein
MPEKRVLQKPLPPGNVRKTRKIRSFSAGLEVMRVFLHR